MKRCKKCGRLIGLIQTHCDECRENLSLGEKFRERLKDINLFGEFK